MRLRLPAVLPALITVVSCTLPPGDVTSKTVMVDPDYYEDVVGGSFLAIAAAGVFFTMGDPGIQDANYTANVVQRIPWDFSLAATEVTNAQFAAFVDDGGYEDQQAWTAAGWAWRLNPSGMPVTEPAFWRDSTRNQSEQPVVGVSWYEAVAFCNWLSVGDGRTPAHGADGRLDFSADGYRLPTEVEWEYASAKGAPELTERPWPHGTVLEPADAAWGLPGTAFPAPVANHRSGDSPQGLCDLAGNAVEWCADNWQAGPSVAAADGVEVRYFFVDDEGTRSFLVRGGDLHDAADEVRAGYRDYRLPTHRGVGAGFRVLRP